MIKDVANKKNNLGIKNIKKIGSLGAASIAETFLCEVTYENKAPEQVVIKLMRPTINRNTLEKEKLYIQDCALKADKTGVMSSTFNAHYKKICEELDLSNECKNALKGEQAYNYKVNNVNVTVQSASIKTEFPVGTDYLVMEKAEGVSADKYIASLYKYGQDKLLTYKNPIQGSDYSVQLGREKELLKVRNEIVQKIKEAEENYKHLEQLTETWILKALFEKVGNSCFLHGDLHAGNIMITNNYLTVLDFGNCTTFDSKGKISSILKMMASAFVGESGRFVTALEELVKLEGKANPYNSLKSSEKKNLMNNLKVEIDKILKLGGVRNTGERIFASILKAQQMGITMPQEMLNFTECQQRLENSLKEFQNGIDDLRKTLATIDTMPVVGADNNKIINPVTYVYYINSKENTTEDVYSKDLTLYYRNFKTDSKNDIIKLLQDKKEYDNHLTFSSNINECLAFKDYYDKCKNHFEKKGKLKKGEKVVDFVKIFSSLQGWKQNYMEFAQISAKKNARIPLTEQETVRYEKLRYISLDILQAARELTDSNEFLSLVGKKKDYVVNIMAKASAGDVTCFDRMVDLLEDRVKLVLETADSYKAVRSYKKDDAGKKILMDKFADKYLQYQKKQLLRNSYSVRIRQFASLDLDQGNYQRFNDREAVLERIRNDINIDNEERRIFKQVNGQYEYGEMAAKVMDLYSEYEKVGKSSDLTPDKKESEQDRIAKELIYHFNYLNLKLNLKYSDDMFENEIGEYMKEDTELSKNLREKFKNFQVIREKYVDQKYKNEFSQEFEDIKNERLKAEDEFTWAVLQLGEEKLKPIMDSFSNGSRRRLNDFVDVMTDVLFSKQDDLLSHFGWTEAMHYGKKINAMMDEM